MKNGVIFVATFLLLKSFSVFIEADLSNLQEGCPNNCQCSYDSVILRIVCSKSPADGPSYTFSLPNVATAESINSIIALNSFIPTFPSTFCNYPLIRYLDLSGNTISGRLTKSMFNCLNTNLLNLQLANNRIEQIEETAFDDLLNIETVNLRNNRISFIPNRLFKHYNLKFIYLQSNLLTQLDSWIFFLPKILIIDLSNNRISQLTNDLKWSPSAYRQSSIIQLSLAQRVDLTNNSITQFDDTILLKFHLCMAFDFQYFVSLFKAFIFTNNPFICNCKSFNTLSFFEVLNFSNRLPPNSPLFETTRCNNPSNDPLYQNKSVFTFINSKQCLNVTSSPVEVKVDDYNYIYCANIGMYIYNKSLTTGNTINALLDSAVTTVTARFGAFTVVDTSLTSSQIAGIIIGLISIALLIIAIICFVCPIEIAGVVLICCPWVINCVKGRHVKRKKYDLFISYNKSSSQWVEQKLIPMITGNRPVGTWCLQYGKENNYGDIGSTVVNMQNSGCILFVLCDSFILKEWNDPKMRSVLRQVVNGSSQTSFIIIQLHDVLDEEVEEYLRSELQSPNIIALENDEFLFWTKLEYLLYISKFKHGVAGSNLKINPSTTDFNYDTNYDDNNGPFHPVIARPSPSQNSSDFNFMSRDTSKYSLIQNEINRSESSNSRLNPPVIISAAKKDKYEIIDNSGRYDEESKSRYYYEYKAATAAAINSSIDIHHIKSSNFTVKSSEEKSTHRFKSKTPPLSIFKNYFKK
jgi:hypothetical protein